MSQCDLQKDLSSVYEFAIIHHENYNNQCKRTVDATLISDDSQKRHILLYFGTSKCYRLNTTLLSNHCERKQQHLTAFMALAVLTCVFK